VTDKMTGPSAQISSTVGSPPKANSKHLSTNIIITNNSLSQDLTFSLMSGPDTVLTEFIARDYTQYSEWIDGLNMLFDKNISSKDTAEYIRILTEIGVKVKLLDLSGEKVEIPQNVEVPNKLPIIGTGGSGFYYDDPLPREEKVKKKNYLSFKLI
jgi:engulfment/cell motility protein 1